MEATVERQRSRSSNLSVSSRYLKRCRNTYLENRILKIKDNSLKKYQDIRGDMIERSYPKQNKLNASDNTLVIVRIESIPCEGDGGWKESGLPVSPSGLFGSPADFLIHLLRKCPPIFKKVLMNASIQRPFSKISDRFHFLIG